MKKLILLIVVISLFLSAGCNVVKYTPPTETPTPTMTVARSTTPEPVVPTAMPTIVK